MKRKNLAKKKIREMKKNNKYKKPVGVGGSGALMNRRKDDGG
jgi:hypothetical protein